MKIKILCIVLLKGLFILGKTNNEVMEIPVIFHVVENKKLNNIEHSKFSQYLDLLVSKANERMNSYATNSLVNGFDKIATPSRIKLYRPQNDSSGKIINNTFWYSKSVIGNNIHIPILNDLSLRKWSKNPKQFLNIWIVDLYDFGVQLDWCSIEYTISDIAGYTPSKFHLLDGIILDSDNIFDIIIDPYLLIHEFGHYLGLKHIWGDKKGCKYDDEIIDTPSQLKPHLLNKYRFVQDSCGGKGKTNHQNFMDYSYDTGMFTEDQVELMRNNLKSKRAGLLWKSSSSIISTSVLSNSKLRNKLGAPFNFNLRLRHNTNIDLTLKDFFERELGIIYNEHNLQKLGLEIIGTDTFKDISTNKKVNQDYIYKYLDIKTAKQIIAAEVDITRKKKQKIYFNIKTGISSGDVGFLYHLSDKEKEAFKNAPDGNFMVLSENPKMTYEFYSEGKRISVAEIPTMKGAIVYNFESGSYRIICKLKTFQMGMDDKPKPYNKQIADITFEHLKKQDNTQTILLIRGDNNSIYQVFER